MTFNCGFAGYFDPCTANGQRPKHIITYSASDHSSIQEGPGGHANGDEWEYSYDASSNLLRMELLNSNDDPIDYQINALDQRVAKHRLNQFSPEVGKHWLWSTDGQLLAAFDDNGDIIRRYIYATRSHVPDLMRAKINGSWGLYRFVTDWRGSVRLVVKVDTGAVVQRLDYTPFGRVLEDTNPGFQPFGFAGGLYDHETGLVRFGARDYNPLIGRWTSKDPILFGGGDTNLYVYVGNDPVNYIDPSGLAATPPNHTPTPTPPDTEPGPMCEMPNPLPLRNWKCTAQCNVQHIGNGNCPKRVRGKSSGKTESLACAAAKKDANNDLPRGCYKRHCKCSCKK